MSLRAGELLQPAHILLDVRATEKNAAIQEVAGLLREDEDVHDFPGFCAELLARDKLRSTAMGNGVAFPHARTDSVGEIVMAAGRSAAGIPFGDEVVRFIFVIGTPREKVGDYLVAVGTMARMLRLEKIRAALAGAKTPEEFLRALA